MSRKKYRQDRVFVERLIEAERLVAAGVSIRKAERLTGVGRTAIRRRIAAMARADRRRRKEKPAVVIDAVTGEERAAVRCPGCGMMVVMPCLACELRAQAGA